MPKGRPKGKEKIRRMVAFRFQAETVERMDKVLETPPQYLFDGFRGYPRTRTELIEVLLYMVSEQKLQAANPPQTNQPPQS